MFKVFKKKKKVGCPVCHEKNTVGFGADYLESKFDSRISDSEKIGSIQTYQCSICKSSFYKEGEMFQRFIDGQIETLRVFSKKDLVLTEKLKSELDKIGLTSDWSMNMLAPAKVTLNNGETLDFATVRVSNQPPIGYYVEHFKRLIFIDEIEKIEPSNYGISKKIREKARDAEEMRMGFYPVTVKDSLGKKIVINGQALFFKNGEISGSDLNLDNEIWNHRKKYIYEDKIDNQVLVVAKE
ncbi:MAG: hypothetical protein Aureis2KO_05000 [Aureisphaera sp.]